MVCGHKVNHGFANERTVILTDRGRFLKELLFQSTGNSYVFYRGNFAIQENATVFYALG